MDSQLRQLARLTKKYFSPFIIRLIARNFLHKKNAKNRQRPLFLILRNQFYSTHKNQISTEYHHLDQTLNKLDIADFEVLTYEGLYFSPIGDLQLIQKCRQLNPDALILSSWGEHVASHPSLRTIQFIREELSIPAISLWWDTCHESFALEIKKLILQFDVHVVMDNPCLHFIDKTDPEFDRILPLWPPQDTNLFHPSNQEPRFQLSFLGQASSYRSYRNEILEYLKLNKVDGFFSAENRESQVSHESYALIMRDSKISLNFSQSVSCNQLKSRVMEILFSGALLFESENEQVQKMFTPFKEYIPFSSKEDLLEKIKYYLSHEEERKKIAEQGYAAVKLRFNNQIFWERILEKIKAKNYFCP